jgi:hypothetical protein
MAATSLLLLMLARLLLATSPATAPASRAPAAGSVLRGIVFDSLAGAPLRAAVVQLVAEDTSNHFGQSVQTDSLGRYEFVDVPSGRYALGFFHERIDALGLELPLRPVLVPRETEVRANLAVPGAATVRKAVCPVAPLDAGVIVGFVRDARTGAAVAGATVRSAWLELSLSARGTTQHRAQRSASTFATGWFALCDVPSPGAVMLVAGRGGDSTDVIEVTVPANGVLQQELHIAPVELRVTTDSAVKSAARVAARAVHVGSGRITGTVVKQDGRQPVADAQVSVVGGPAVRTNARGEFALTDAPLGTRTLDVRAVGHYPDRRTVTVRESSAPVLIALSSLRAVLDTMKVRASPLINNVVEFEKRRRMSQGRFLSRADIAKLNPLVTSDVFRSISGVALEFVQLEDLRSQFDSSGDEADLLEVANTSNEKRIVMRGTFAPKCLPAIFVNGHFMRSISATDLDVFAHPSELMGIEVYQGAQAPPPFQIGNSKCGAVLLWTK